jgi:hypothetical protein
MDKFSSKLIGNKDIKKDDLVTVDKLVIRASKEKDGIRYWATKGFKFDQRFVLSNERVAKAKSKAQQYVDEANEAGFLTLIKYTPNHSGFMVYTSKKI